MNYKIHKLVFISRASLVALVGKESTCNAGDPSLILEWGRFTWEGIGYPLQFFLGFPGGSVSKESNRNVGDLCSIPGLGRSPGEGKGFSLQYSCLENSMDSIVHGVANSWTWLSNFQFLSLLAKHYFSAIHPIQYKYQQSFIALFHYKNVPYSCFMDVLVVFQISLL